MILTPVIAVLLVVALSSLKKELFVQQTLVPVLRFLIVLAVGTTIAMFRVPHVSRVLGLFGRYALLVFLFHRVLLHALLIAETPLSLPPAERYLFLASVCLIGALMLCALRHGQRWFDRLCAV